MATLNNQIFDIFKKGSKTYFYSSLLFPLDVRDDIFILYSFVRTADNFVDAVPQQKKEFLLFIDQFLDGLKDNSSPNFVIDGFLKLMKRKEIKPKLVKDFLKAMHQDLIKKNYKTLQETEDYIYGSAEVVGLMMSAILGVEKTGYPYAKLLGKSMQYINFLRDIAEDNSLGRTYIPQEVLIKYDLKNLTEQEAHKKPEQFKECIRAEITRYRNWQNDAEKGFKFIPKKYQLAIKTASDLYKWTADQIYADPFIVFNKKVKPSIGTIITHASSNLFGNII